MLVASLAGWFVAGPGLSAASLATYSRFRGVVENLHNPGVVVINRANEIFIAERRLGQIRVIDAKGKELRTLFADGESRDQLQDPRGLALLSDRELLVSDSGARRILLISTTGGERRVWCDARTVGRAFRPTGIWVTTDRVFVADVDCDRIRIFNFSGALLRSFPEENSEIQLHRPTSVAVNEKGLVFVTDSAHDRVCVFDGGGKAIRWLGGFGEFPGFLAHPSGVVTAGPWAFVADTENHRIQIFDGAGAWKGVWGQHAVLPREGKGRLHYPSHIALAPSGEFAVVCEEFENRCQIFDRDDGIVEPTVDPGRSAVRASSHYGARGDAQGGLLALVEPESHRITVLDLVRANVPIQITRLGRRGERYGEFLQPNDVKLSRDGKRLSVCDVGTRRIQQFSLTVDLEEPLRFDPEMARFVKGIDFDDAAMRRPELRFDAPILPTALEEDDDGRLYVLDGANRQVLVFGSDWQLKLRFGQDGRVRLKDPTDLVFGKATGHLYVVDRESASIHAFDREGKWVRTIQADRARDGVSITPFSVLEASGGVMFITDEASHRVVRLDYESQELGSAWGERGLGAVQFYKPKGILEDPAGRLMVIDYGNHRVQILDKSGAFVDIFGSRFYTIPARESLRDPEEES